MTANFAWLLLLVAGLLEIVWSISMKASQGFTKPLLTTITLVAAGLSFWLLGLAVATMLTVERALDGGPNRYLWLDALTQKVREGGRVVNVSVVVATAVNTEGRREILGIEVGTSEDGAFWLGFLRGLVARGLSGVELVTSDAHEGRRLLHLGGMRYEVVNHALYRSARALEEKRASDRQRKRMSRERRQDTVEVPILDLSRDLSHKSVTERDPLLSLSSDLISSDPEGVQGEPTEVERAPEPSRVPPADYAATAAQRGGTAGRG